MHICLFWHFHQPVYKDPDRGRYVLPWVNFHAVKNYRQMAFLSAESGFPSTFNFVPCLLEQVQDYALNRADDPFQESLETPPERLEEADWEKLRLFQPDGSRDRAAADAALRALFSPVDQPGRDRDSLLALRRQILEGLLPSYGRLWDEGIIELTASAMYHPLLPLVFDLGVAGEGNMPGRPFRYPGDGRAQIARGRETFSRIFGRAPAGFWPSEGGISQEVTAAVAEAGYLFAVSDESVLWKSGGDGVDTRARMRPHVCGGLPVFFRDRELSDLIGFEYGRWDERQAVSDLLARVKARSAGAEEADVTVVALDGENPWGCYRENGVPFLRELFDRFGREPGLQPLTFSEYLRRFPASRELSLRPGTWLGGFSKWVGHPAKNAAWEALGRAREDLGPSEELLVAEGSDWFWWYGEPGTEVFDGQFRGYLRKAYRTAGRPEPESA